MELLISRWISAVLTIVAIVFVLPIPSQAAYPDKPIRFVIPFAPGGTADILARAISQRMSTTLGQNIIMHYKAGADGNIGAEYAATASPDGYTLLFISSVLVLNSNFYPDQKYDPVRDFSPISRVGEFPYLVVVNSSVNAKTLPELIALSKKDKPLFYGSSSSLSSLGIEGLKKSTGLRAERVNFSGAAPVTVALLGGEIQLTATSPINVIGLIKAGKLRPITITTKTRSPLFPDVPTVADSGLGSYEYSQWLGLLAPAGTPRDIVNLHNKALHDALAYPELKATLEATSLIIAPNTPAAFADLIKSEIIRNRDLVKSTGITK